jgi:YVTN family beta-propeller protein
MAYARGKYYINTSQLIVIDAETLTLDPIPQLLTDTFSNLVISKDNNLVFTPKVGKITRSEIIENDQVKVYDLEAETTDTLTIFNHRINDITKASDGYVYASSDEDNVLIPIDRSSLVIGSDLPISSPRGAGEDDLMRLWVTSKDVNQVNCIDVNPLNGTYKTIIHTVNVGSKPNSIVFCPKYKKLFVTNSGSNTISVIDLEPTSLTYLFEKTQITVGNTPTSIDISKDNKYIYTNSNSDDKFYYINADSEVVEAIKDTGTSPTDVSYNEEYTSVFVSCQDTDEIIKFSEEPNFSGRIIL